MDRHEYRRVANRRVLTIDVKSSLGHAERRLGQLQARAPEDYGLAPETLRELRDLAGTVYDTLSDMHTLLEPEEA